MGEAALWIPYSGGGRQRWCTDMRVGQQQWLLQQMLYLQMLHLQKLRVRALRKKRSTGNASMGLTAHIAHSTMMRGMRVSRRCEDIDFVRRHRMSFTLMHGFNFVCHSCIVCTFSSCNVG